MNIVQVKVDDLKPYENNPRRNEHVVPAIMQSIKEYGFLVPLVITADNTVVTGHTRLKASKLLGMDTVPCIVADNLTERQIKAFRIADNKLSEHAEWSEDMLKQELSDLKKEGLDMSLTGFSFMELEELLNDMAIEDENSKDSIPEMELKSFESYDYIVVVFDDIRDFAKMSQYLDLKKVNGSWSKKTKKIGVGRVVKGGVLMDKIFGGNDVQKNS